MIPPVIMAFLTELFNRIKTKSPKFFFVLQVISAGLFFAGSIPAALNDWFGIECSASFVAFCKYLSAVSLGFFSSAILAVKNPTVAQTGGGDDVKRTDEKKMPFTAKVEAQEMEKAVPQPPVVDVPEVK